MIDSSQARLIIELALQKGLIHQEQISLCTPTGYTEPEVWSARLKEVVHKGILTEKIVQTLSDEVVAFRLLQTQSPDNTLLLAQSDSGTVTETTLAFQPAPEPLHLASVSQLPTQMATPGATPHQSAPKSGINRELEFRQVGRYEIVRRIGEGGMGTVYEAFDPLLKRPVALKFLIKDNPTLVQRLLMEGRSQAQIDHPNVCRVYEVGEFEGRYFIAMQYLPGQTLDKAMAGLSVEQKIKIMVEVADALQAAHKEGLIHRDIKPHNIIVGTGEDGLLKPYVMDFGLARQVAASGMTVEGALLGTPYYMSPEQARGETDRLDRRTDIYSLGVTLYELLSGKVPFSQGSIMEVLLKVIQDEAPPLRTLDSRIPVDLETIVMKCLEKEPQQRYDSARALQDDLLRFLAGEPIQGRPVSVWFRAKKLLYKHRVATSIVATALGIGLFFLVSGVHALWQARQQSELARQLGERVKEIETIMRHGHMLPRHNIAREEAMVRERMRAVEATMNSFGKISEGPGHYAIGRGHLALGEYQAARTHLEAAWNNGYQTSETAYALGLVLGELFQQRLDEAKAISNKELYQVEVKKAEEELKQPALRYLQQGRQAPGEAAEYVEALMYWHDQKWPEALVKAEIALKKIPWLYEAQRLIGQIYLDQGIKRLEAGEHMAALDSLKQAEAAFRQAQMIAESDLETYKELAWVGFHTTRLLMTTGQPFQEMLDQSRTVCDQGITVSPGKADLYLVSANISILQAQTKTEKGEDPALELEGCIEKARAALAVDPHNAFGFRMLGEAFRQRGIYVMDKGQNPGRDFQSAIDFNRQAVSARPNDGINHFYLGWAYWSLGEYQLVDGENPVQSYDLAAGCYTKVLELSKPTARVYNSLANVFLSKGEYLATQGQNPVPVLNQAIETYQRALELNPNLYGALINTATAFTDIIAYKIDHGQDPAAEFEESIRFYERGIAANPKNPIAYNNFAQVYMQKAQYLADQKQDPIPLLNQALETLAKGLKIRDNDAYTYLYIGRAHLIEASYQTGIKQDPAAALTSAIQAFQHAQELNPTFFEAWSHEGQAQAIALEWLLDTGQPFSERIFAKAQTVFRKTIELNKEYSAAHNQLAKLQWLRARWLIAQKKDALATLNSGLEEIKQGIDLKGDNPEFHITQGKLFALKAQIQKDPVPANQLREQARQSFTKAVELNPEVKADVDEMLKDLKR